MDRNKLLETLKNLHTELERAESVDEESNQLLHTVMNDIRRLVDEGDVSASDAGKSINERLKKVAVKFEADHPRVAMTMNEVLDALNKMGI